MLQHASCTHICISNESRVNVARILYDRSSRSLSRIFQLATDLTALEGKESLLQLLEEIDYLYDASTYLREIRMWDLESQHR